MCIHPELLGSRISLPCPKCDLEAQTLLDEGFLHILVDLDKLGDYWFHMIQEYPDHPAAANPMGSIPIMLYGNLPKLSIKFTIFWIEKNIFFPY